MFGMTVPAPTGDDQAQPDPEPDPASDPPAAESHTPERTQVFAEIAVAVVTAVSTVAGAVWLGGPWRKIIAFGMIVLVLLAVAHAWRFRADPMRRTPHPVTVAVLAVGATILLVPLLPSAVTDTDRTGAAPASSAPPSASPAALPSPTIGPFTILRPGAQVPECSDVVGTGTIPAGYGLLLFVSATRGGDLFYEKPGKPSGDGTWLATTVHVGGTDDLGEFTITAILVDAAWAAFFDKIVTPAGLSTPALPPGVPVGSVNVMRTGAKGTC